MNPIEKMTTPQNLPHEVFVVIGGAAVQTYLGGTKDPAVLSGFGAVKTYRFATLREMNAFMFGLEITAEAEDALAVDDLT